jgi:hypothetical protein
VLTTKFYLYVQADFFYLVYELRMKSEEYSKKKWESGYIFIVRRKEGKHCK